MNDPWEGLAPATMQFCEETVAGWIRCPANTWSNLAYVFAGIAMIVIYLLDQRKTGSCGIAGREPILGRRPGSGRAWMLSPIAITIGVSSFLYHASGAFLLQLFDLSSMYLFSAFLLARNTERICDKKRVFWFVFFFVFIATTMTLLLLQRQWGAVLFGIEIIAAILLEILLWKRAKEMEQRRIFVVSIIVFAPAWAIWLLDFSKIWCDPANHIVQGHAVWHLLTAISFGAVWLFYRNLEIDA